MNILVFFAFCEYSVCICLVFFRILNICWYSQHPVQIDMRMLLVFLAQCPHTEICKMEFAWIFFHSHKYLQYFNAFGNYMSTYQKHFCIWKIHFKGLLPVLLGEQLIQNCSSQFPVFFQNATYKGMFSQITVLRCLCRKSLHFK